MFSASLACLSAQPRGTEQAAALKQSTCAVQKHFREERASQPDGCVLLIKKDVLLLLGGCDWSVLPVSSLNEPETWQQLACLFPTMLLRGVSCVQVTFVLDMQVGVMEIPLRQAEFLCVLSVWGHVAQAPLSTSLSEETALKAVSHFPELNISVLYSFSSSLSFEPPCHFFHLHSSSSGKIIPGGGNDEG